MDHGDALPVHSLPALRLPRESTEDVLNQLKASILFCLPPWQEERPEMHNLWEAGFPEGLSPLKASLRQLLEARIVL